MSEEDVWNSFDSDQQVALASFEGKVRMLKERAQILTRPQ